MDERDSQSATACLAPPTEDVLNAAMREHQAGRFAEAAALYGQVLQEAPSNVAALHLLGVLYHQHGEYTHAIGLIGRAAQLRPDVGVIQASLAEALFALGHYVEAEVAARSVLRLGTDDPAVRCLLGRALEAQGRYQDAAWEFRQAIQLRPDFAPAYNDLGDTLRSLGRPEDARVAYHEAIRLAPNFASAHASLGRLSLQEARHEEALRSLERAVELEPGGASHWEGLADVFERLQRFDAAVTCWERVLTLSPGNPVGPRLALSRVLRKEGRGEEAEEQAQIAVTLAPGSADARYRVGVLHEERGAFAEAEASFREALRLQPTHDLARVRLVALLRHALPDADLAALEDRVRNAETDGEPRVRLLFAWGQALDARGDYAGAADQLREANRLGSSLARGDRRFQPELLERFADDTTRAFDPAFFARTAGAGLDTRRPVFIVGLPRSGTTLIEQILASHRAVHGAGELALAQQMYDSLPTSLKTDATPIACVAKLDAAMVRQLAGAYFNRLRTLTGDRAEHVVDKMPENYKHLGLLSALFPNAAIIHCRRDLRDVALSCWMTDFQSVLWAHDPAHIATAFRVYQRLMDHWRTALPATIHEVNYEETVSDLEGVARRLLAALGLDWDPACLEFHRTPRAIRTGSLHQVRQPLYRQSVGRWKHYHNELADLFAALPQPTA